MIIREEARQDDDGISALLSAAFERPAEAVLVGALREAGDLAFAGVAAIGDEIIGYAAFSKMTAPFPALGLGPVATSTPHRRAGTASALIRWGLARAESENWRAVFVLGDPAFYQRFGFDAALARGFVSPYAGPHFMGLALGRPRPTLPGKLIVGKLDYAPAFASFARV